MRQTLHPVRRLSRFRHVPKAFGLVWRAAPGWTIASGALLVVQGVLPVMTVYLTRALVDGLAAVVGQGWRWDALYPVLAIGGVMAGVLAVDEVMGSVSAYVRTGLAEQAQDHMNGLVQDKAATLDMQFYESAEYYDLMHRASVEAVDRPLALLENFGSLIQSLITLTAMSGVLLKFAWWMPLALLASTLPALWVAFRNTWRFHVWRVRNTVNQRRLAYYHRGIISDVYAAEMRLFGLADRFRRNYRSLRARLRKERLSIAWSEMLNRTGAGLFGLAAMALTLLWLGYKAAAGRFTLGDMAMFYQAMNQGQKLMRTLLGSLGDIYRNILFLEDLFTFLELPAHVQGTAREEGVPAPPCPPLCDEIRLEGVEFSYPGDDRPALCGFNLTIPAGRTVAVVGRNGAGKSTLLKLLCRFYDPVVGRVTWDGVDLREMDPVDIRRRITVLFQQPAAFHETVADNIAFGDLRSCPGKEKIEEAAAQAGADSVIHKLPEGYYTVLGKWFGHTDLSAGEWQRVALARAFVRQADLIVLDEPTSAMDSWAEASWMARFRELATGRTAVIITHRFTTALQADVIHVMEDGRVVESGSHAELLALGGRYAQSWKAQTRGSAAGGPSAKTPVPS